MGLFENALKDGESLFRNELALDFTFIPKVIPYRESQQQRIATCIRPLISGRNGKNLFLYGPPGIGKTAACLHLMRELEEDTEAVYPVYVNCWQKNTTFQVYTEICHQLNYMFTQNKRTEDLLEVIKGLVNKKAAVFIFDEIDKAEDLDFLYSLLSEIYNRTMILITNYKEWFTNMEDRLRSRLLPEMLEFQQYNAQEIEGILKQRIEYAFVPGVWDIEAFNLISSKTIAENDVRIGVHLLREAGLVAEEGSSKKVTIEHAKEAVERVSSISLQSTTDLEEDTRIALDVVKANSGEKIGDLYKVYKEKGGKGTYKTFQRKIAKLDKHNFISTNKVTGKEGNTTIVSYGKEKKLSDF